MSGGPVSFSNTSDSQAPVVNATATADLPRYLRAYRSVGEYLPSLASTLDSLRQRCDLDIESEAVRLDNTLDCVYDMLQCCAPRDGLQRRACVDSSFAAADAALTRLLGSGHRWQVRRTSADATSTVAPWAAVVIHLYTMPKHETQAIAVHDLVNKTLRQEVVPADERVIGYAKCLYKALTHVMSPAELVLGPSRTLYRHVAADVLRVDRHQHGPSGGPRRSRSCPS